MQLSLIGHFVELCWEAVPAHFPQVRLDAFVIMPNHFHGNLHLGELNLDSKATHGSPLREGEHLGAIIGQFKSSVTRRLNKLPEENKVQFEKIWQRNYYEKIIRDESHLITIRDYIINNPTNWANDKLHPNAPKNQFNKDWFQGSDS